MLPVNKDIEMVRGDTYAFGIKVFIDELPDQLSLTCFDAETYSDIFTNIFQLYENHLSESRPYVSYKIRIAPEDTRNLIFRDYIYEIKIVLDEEYVRTILKGNLTLIPEVTREEQL